MGEFLIDHIKDNSNLSFVTAYFTMYAYEKLKPQLDNVNSLRLLFGEPRFIKSVASSTNAKSYGIEDDQLVIPVESRIQQKASIKNSPKKKSFGKELVHNFVFPIQIMKYTV